MGTSRMTNYAASIGMAVGVLVGFANARLRELVAAQGARLGGTFSSSGGGETITLCWAGE